MHEVLETHGRRKKNIVPALPSEADRDERRNADIHPPPAKRTTPEDIPLLKAGHQGCIHCHQVREYRLLQAFHDKTFSRDILFEFPLPENVGIRVDRSHGHKIAAVIPDSPAARAGLSAGDVVIRVGDVPIHSEQDIRWALHRAGESDRPAVTVLRPGKDADGLQTLRANLALGANWRQTELGWRKSLRSMPLPLGFLAYPLGREERRTANLPENRMAIKVVSIRGAGLAQNVGLEKGDFIIGLDGREAVRSFEEFKSDLLRRYLPGDTVHLTVLRNEKPLELTGLFPEWNTTGTSVP
jgi:predicted metalloprotease with PDZ domain